MQPSQPAGQRALLSALVMLLGGVAVMVICAFLDMPGLLCVAIGLVAMFVVNRSFR